MKILALLPALFVLSACSQATPEQTLIGTWRHVKAPAEIEFKDRSFIAPGTEKPFICEHQGYKNIEEKNVSGTAVKVITLNCINHNNLQEKVVIFPPEKGTQIISFQGAPWSKISSK
jgi:hypothetical protein